MTNALSDYRFSGAGVAEVKSIETAADGSLVIEGFGALYELDREDEAFEEGAFTRGLKAFLSGNAPLVYHHKIDQVIGRVVDAKLIPGKGVWLKAVVDYQNEYSPLRHVYNSIKSGAVNGFSVGGIFHRRMTPNGPRIHDVDIVEWSATAAPVGKSSTFSVIAGKALSAEAIQQDKTDAVAALRDETASMLNELELTRVRSQISRLESERVALDAKASTDAFYADQDAADTAYASKAAGEAARAAASAPARPVAVPGGSGVAVVSERPPIGDLASIQRSQRWNAERARLQAERDRDIADALTAGRPVPRWRHELPLDPPDPFEQRDSVVTVTETTPYVPPGNQVEIARGFDALGRRVIPRGTETPLTVEEQLALAQASDADRPGMLARFRAKLAERIGLVPTEPGPQFTPPTVRTYEPYANQPSPEDVFRAIAAETSASRAHQARERDALDNEGISYE